MNISKILQSKKFKWLICGIAAFIVLLFVFKLGMVVGFRKADFSYKWGENYHRNFGGPRAGFFNNFSRDFMARDFIDAHGVFGQIIKIDGATLVIKGGGNVEKIVLVEENTIINRFRDAINISDLKVDDYITVVGEPNASGQIEAKLIRIFK